MSDVTRSGRVAAYLPAFLHRGQLIYDTWTLKNLKYLPLAVGTASADLAGDIQELRARGAANRFDEEFAEYYGALTMSAERQADVARLGMSRLLSKRGNETWDEFEERVRAFVGAEVWDGSLQHHTVTGDVARWGGFVGITTELERTGLAVDNIWCASEHPEAWIVLSLADQEVVEETDQSKVYAVAEAVPAGQRTTRVFDLGFAQHGFFIELSNPEIVAYSEEEVKEIVKLTKPAWAAAWVLFPSASEWVEVI